ncbi:lytic transglycosylase domain-containing protein [Pacificibacter marinus]|uniref:lytic transglycosylase domain-containing protein n=1 Tax=Pacificibacter marinus TaxID=658057 RepID=UPI001C07A125|nr:lytic transglycosylase domain-containing protein [Pacificibacter marinus]MBU2865571.1 transglycosylase SLT domain-containing protein [Pacificibacter marinus]
MSGITIWARIRARVPRTGVPKCCLYTGLIWGLASAAPLAVLAQTSPTGPTGPSVIGPKTGSTVKKVTPSLTPAPWPKVTPRRLTPPKSGTTNRITVQIRPSSPSAPQGPSGPTGPLPAGTVMPLADVPKAPADLQDWYWTVVPHDVAGAGPERFAQALAALDNDGAAVLSTPSFQHVTDLANRYGTDLLIHSIGTDVSPALALAVIAVESAGKTNAVSGAGAQGLMQLIPATAARFGVTDPMDPSQNISGGITYLDWLIKEFKGDVILALAGYNAGENAVKDNRGVPPYPETRAYVPKVLAAWQVARRLCVTQPELYSDGCVFATNALRSSN